MNLLYGPGFVASEYRRTHKLLSMPPTSQCTRPRAPFPCTLYSCCRNWSVYFGDSQTRGPHCVAIAEVDESPAMPSFTHY